MGQVVVLDKRRLAATRPGFGRRDPMLVEVFPGVTLQELRRQWDRSPAGRTAADAPAGSIRIG